VAKGFRAPLPTRCDFCHKDLAVSGPLWVSPLADKRFCQDMITASSTVCSREGHRLSTLLHVIQNETDFPPTYFVTDRICQKIGVPSQSKNEIIRRLTDQGYRATQTHFNVRGIKTDASVDVIKDIIQHLNG
jgi:tRNA (guanine26-N2/guanine27-N2)-dimethyltransferase